MMSSSLDTIIETLQELERLHQLNLELLEQLNVISGWLVEHKISIPNPQVLYSLLARAKSLLNDIQSDEPKILQYQPIRRKVTESKSDGEVTVPVFHASFNPALGKRITELYAYSLWGDLSVAKSKRVQRRNKT